MFLGFWPLTMSLLVSLVINILLVSPAACNPRCMYVTVIIVLYLYILRSRWWALRHEMMLQKLRILGTCIYREVKRHCVSIVQCPVLQNRKWNDLNFFFKNVPHSMTILCYFPFFSWTIFLPREWLSTSQSRCSGASRVTRKSRRKGQTRITRRARWKGHVSCLSARTPRSKGG